jgi:hypothetical protein
MSTRVQISGRPRHNITVDLVRCRNAYDIYMRVAQRMRAERVSEIELARYFGAYIQTALQHGSDDDEGFTAMLAMTQHWVNVWHR